MPQHAHLHFWPMSRSDLDELPRDLGPSPHRSISHLFPQLEGRSILLIYTRKIYVEILPRAYWPVCGTRRASSEHSGYLCDKNIIANCLIFEILFHTARNLCLSFCLWFTWLEKPSSDLLHTLQVCCCRPKEVRRRILCNSDQQHKMSDCTNFQVSSTGEKAACLPASFPFSVRNGCCRKEEVKMFFSDPHVGLLLTCGLHHLLPRQPSKACSYHHPF